MTPETVQLITSLAGFAVAALGIWVAHKARQAPLHEALYTRQLEASAELSARVTEFILRIQNIYPSPDSGASDDIWNSMDRMLQVQIQNSVLLPQPIVQAFDEFRDAASSILDSGDLFEPSHRARMGNQLAVAGDSLFNVIRGTLGIDGLSKQTQRFFPDDASRPKALWGRPVQQRLQQQESPEHSASDEQSLVELPKSA